MSGNGVHELLLGFVWLIQTLSGDSTLMGYATGGVYRGLAPPSTVPPYIITAHQTGSDITTVNGFRVFVEATYQVKVVGPASETATLALAAAQLDTILGGTTNGPASGDVLINSVKLGRVLACWRQSPLVVDELVNGEQWTNVGGLYRLQIEQVTS